MRLNLSTLMSVSMSVFMSVPDCVSCCVSCCVCYECSPAGPCPSRSCCFIFTHLLFCCACPLGCFHSLFSPSPSPSLSLSLSRLPHASLLSRFTSCSLFLSLAFAVSLIRETAKARERKRVILSVTQRQYPTHRQYQSKENVSYMRQQNSMVGAQNLHFVCACYE